MIGTQNKTVVEHWQERAETAEARVEKLERAIRMALGHRTPGQLTPLIIREILMEGLRV